MRSIAEALASMLPAFAPLEEEEMHLTEAGGRYLSRLLHARFDSPPFDNSAMDGYAVRATDLAGASRDELVRLPIRGESRAGGPLPAALAPGTACRIFTGAPMPSGADAVVIQEDVAHDGEDVLIRESSTPAKHVRAQGSDLRSGAVLLRAGDRLWPGEIGLLASQNIDRVHVFRQPKVALLSTGDELCELGDELAAGQIVNSNVYALTEMLRALGAIPVPLPVARDTLADIDAALRKALEADVVITMGGASVGTYDFVQEAFANVGVELGFWKVRIKPGKPLIFAQHQGKPVIGVPGNPISAMITFEVLIAPCLRSMLGDPQPHPQPVIARLRQSYQHRPGRVEIARGVATREGDEILVTLHERQGSGSLPSFVGTNALVILPSDRAEIAAGERVEAILWGPGLKSERSWFESMG